MATNTTATSVQHNGNGSTASFAITFAFLANAEVDVTVGGVLKTLGTHYNISGSTVTFTSGNIPPSGTNNIKFQRDTDISAKKVDFQDGSVLTEVDLDTQNDQVLFAQQEILDKLAGVEEGATADQTNAEIKTAYEANSNTNAFTDAEKTKLTNIEASATADQTAAEIRTLVENASDSNVFTDADHSKLNAIEAGATADQTNAEIRAAIEAASDSNVFTDADHTKLNGIEAGATADQSNAEIKTAYEANSNTNAFTDAEKTKLTGIETGATADQTNAEIRAAVEAATDSNVFTDADHSKLNAIEASATADQTDAEIKTAYENNSDTNAFTDAEKTKLTSVESNADVTDATNVDAAGAVMNSDLDGKGEILVGDGSGDPSALAVGQNGYILTADSTEATGVKWAANSGGGGGSGISDVVSDTTPQLGGNLDVQTNEITTSTSNGNIKLNPNGTGVVEVKGDGSSADGTIQLNCSQNSHGVKIKSPPHSANASYTLTLPNTDGNANQVLKTDGSGNLDWVNQTDDQTASEIVALVADQTIAPSTIDMEDNEIIKLGTGDDLQIYHDGSNSFIHNNTGQLEILGVATSPSTATSQIKLVDGEAVIRGKSAQNAVRCIANGPTELYHSGSKKFETTSSGVDITGTCTATAFAGDGSALTGIGSGVGGATGIDFNDDVKIRLGTGNDLEIYHDGSNSYIKDAGTGSLLIDSNSGVLITTDSFTVNNAANSENMIYAAADGGVNLYYNSTAHFQTVSSGVNVSSGNLQIGGTNVLNSGRTLYNLESIELADNKQAIFGDGGDLRIWHDGNSSIIRNVNTSTPLYIQPADSETGIKLIPNGATELYYDNSKKLETTNTGIEIIPDGTTTSAAFSSSGLELVDNNSGQGENGTTSNVLKFHDTDTSTATNQTIGRVDFESSDGTSNGVVARVQGQSRDAYGGGEISLKVASQGYASPTLSEKFLVANKNYCKSDLNFPTIGTTATGYSIQGIGVGNAVCILRQRESHASNGGTFTSGADRTRILNEEEHDGTSFCTLDTSTGEFTLPEGVYLIHFYAQAHDVSVHRAKIVTDGGDTVLYGSNVASNTTSPSTVPSSGFGILSHSGGEGYYLKHRCQTTKATSGFGLDCNFGSELEYYAQVTIFRITS